MVKGRLKRESNPMPGEKAGFTAQHDSTGNEDYVNTSPKNPLPTKDVDVKTELESIKETQQQILNRLNDPIDTQLIGSNVEHYSANNVVISPSSTYNTGKFPSVGNKIKVVFRDLPSEIDVVVGFFINGNDSRYVYSEIPKETEGRIRVYKKYEASSFGGYFRVEIRNNGDEDAEVGLMLIVEEV